MKYVYIGVENRNGNRYEKTITHDEFMKTIDWSVMNDRFGSLYDVIVREVCANISNPETHIEHVDTYLEKSGDWRVQVWMRIHRYHDFDGIKTKEDLWRVLDTAFYTWKLYESHFSNYIHTRAEISGVEICASLTLIVPSTISIDE